MNRKDLKTEYYRLFMNKQSVPSEGEWLHLVGQSVQASCTTTNLIWKVQVDGKNLYFRECADNISPQARIKKHIAAFFWLCRNNGFFGQEKCVRFRHEASVIDGFESYINRCLSEDFYRKFARLNQVLNRHGFSTYRVGTALTPAAYTELGLEELDPAHQEIFKLFAFYFYKAFDPLTYVRGSRRHNCISANSFFATYRLAKHFGIEDIISEPVWVEMAFPFGESLRGFACEEITDGEFAGFCLIPATPKMQHALSDLNLLDIMCNHYDHGPNNYFVILQEQEIVSVRCFDNEGSAFRYTANIKYSASWNCSPIIGDDGTIRRPCLDQNLVEKILSVTYSQLARVLHTYLYTGQTAFVYLRILSLKKALKKTLKLRPDLAIADDQWSEDTLQQEFSGDWGRTYTWIYRNIPNE